MAADGLSIGKNASRHCLEIHMKNNIPINKLAEYQDWLVRKGLEAWREVE